MTTQHTSKNRGFSYGKWGVVLFALVLIAAYLDWRGSTDERVKKEAASAPHTEPMYGEVMTGTTTDSIPTFKHPEAPSYAHPWIAVIIDDFGSPGSFQLLGGFLDLPFEITLSIIPGYDRSGEIGRIVQRRGRELFIHLPMEPTEPVAMGERYMLFVGSDSGTVTRLFDRICAELPMAIGMNNHMGSRATADIPLMRLVAQELHRRNLIFYDSWTTRETVAYSVMREYRIPSTRRDVFLDNIRDEQMIRRQLELLANTARRRSWAIGTGHAHKETLALLQKELPRLTNDGFRIVPLGRLTRALVEKEVAANR